MRPDAGARLVSPRSVDFRVGNVQAQSSHSAMTVRSEALSLTRLFPSPSGEKVRAAPDQGTSLRKVDAGETATLPRPRTLTRPDGHPLPKGEGKNVRTQRALNHVNSPAKAFCSRDWRRAAMSAS